MGEQHLDALAIAAQSLASPRATHGPPHDAARVSAYRRLRRGRNAAAMDAQRWDSGERIVFEPYSREMYEQSFEWIEKHGIFDAGKMGDGSYEKATVGFGVV